MADASEDLQASLAALRVTYVAQLGGKLAAIEGSLDALTSEGWSVERVQTARRLVHGITGSGATFGFPVLSEKSRALETELVDQATAGTDPGPEGLQRIRLALDALLAAVPGPRPEPEPPPTDGAAPAEPVPPREVWFLDVDTLPGERLDSQLGQLGYSVRRFTDTEQLIKAAPESATACTLVVPADLTSGNPSAGTEEGIAAVERFQDAAPEPLRVIFTGGSVGIDTRLRAVRAGGAAWVPTEAVVRAVVEELQSFARRPTASPYRVLIVEDDAHQAQAAEAALADAGCMTAVVPGAHELLDALDALSPDVILMDLYLGDCLGSELAAVIRQQEVHLGIPIVYLSSEADQVRQHRALLRGGDAFLHKPVDPARLVETVLYRAERSRSYREQLLHDGLTGALNHAALESRLVADVAAARRHGKALAFAMLDLDDFKQVNDRHGHRTGDHVLRNLAHLLRHRLRASDIIGRYGGEEFGLILPETNQAQAFLVVDELRHRFAELKHEGPHGDVQVTFSAGVAAFPGHDGASVLVSAADAALYRAKRAGKNRVLNAE